MKVTKSFWKKRKNCKCETHVSSKIFLSLEQKAHFRAFVWKVHEISWTTRTSYSFSIRSSRSLAILILCNSWKTLFRLYFEGFACLHGVILVKMLRKRKKDELSFLSQELFFKRYFAFKTGLRNVFKIDNNRGSIVTEFHALFRWSRTVSFFW